MFKAFSTGIVADFYRLFSTELEFVAEADFESKFAPPRNYATLLSNWRHVEVAFTQNQENPLLPPKVPSLSYFAFVHSILKPYPYISEYRQS